ncbi:MAG: helix-turn-helix domain-containing protein [Chloroflexi bacterium]|nr:MAG: hypothetical protein CUN54_06190 [Phototrophicales bacterium]RMF79135.1 MAG: helix-turn-helix domain-containing protein [Chloroflexota bacterium]
MAFNDSGLADRLRKARGEDKEAEEKPMDFAESYRLRGKMLGVLLRDARIVARRSIEDCAALLHMSPQEYEAWEYGDVVPGLPQLEILAYYLGVPVKHFWGAELIGDSERDPTRAQDQYIALRNRMIGALLRQAREEAGLSIEEVAQNCGLDATQVEAYELGDAQPPMHELSVLASAVRKTMSYFLESSSYIGELLAQREAWERFTEMSEEMQQFVANPRNIGYIHIAMMFSQMPPDKLRDMGESMLEITL